MDPLRIGVAVLVICAVIANVLWMRAREAKAATRRREAMMKRVGVAPRFVSLATPHTRALGKQVRRKCAKCTHEDYCERWLVGAVKGSNAFCPNAETFEELSKKRPSANGNDNGNEKAA